VGELVPTENWTISTDCNRDNQNRLDMEQSAPTVNGTISSDCKCHGTYVEESWIVGWIVWVLGHVFSCFLVSVLYLVPCMVLVSFAGWGLR